jgi:hypothetical protein
VRVDDLRIEMNGKGTLSGRKVQCCKREENEGNVRTGLDFWIYMVDTLNMVLTKKKKGILLNSNI